jgi:hemerythrin-like domain-containing protein
VKRTPELAPLSRDHHIALEQALRLRRATDEDVADVVAGFFAFLEDHARSHFAEEEAVLAPVVPADCSALADRMVEEHESILRRATALGERPETGPARELGELLSAHVRFEERELFPLLERRLPSWRLAAIGRRLEG